MRRSCSNRDLPGVHGDEVCARLVAAGGRSRVMMLTGAAENEDLVDGLGLGADDHLAKPFSFAVLVARIGALARRAQPSMPPVLVASLFRQLGQVRGGFGLVEAAVLPAEPLLARGSSAKPCLAAG